jgi:hypothetical protein
VLGAVLLGCRRLGIGRHGRHIVLGRREQQLAAQNGDHGKNPAQCKEAAADAELVDEILAEPADIDGGAAVSGNHGAGDQSAFVGAEPFQGCRRGRRIAQAHADAAQDTEAEDQAQLAFHQGGDHAAQGQEEAAGGGADLGSEFILDPSAGNHEHGKQDHTDGKRCGRLGVGEIGPPRIDTGHDLSRPVDVDQCLFPNAPRI